MIDTVHTRIWDTDDRKNSSAEDSNDELVDTNAIYRGTKKPHILDAKYYHNMTFFTHMYDLFYCTNLDKKECNCGLDHLS
jgi:hypothetical protein